MFSKKKNSSDDVRLDEFGRAIVRASAENEAVAETVSSAPFLYARLSARIAAERARREEGEGWFALPSMLWHAVPSMALVAVLAFSLFWSISFGTQPAQGFSDAALLGEHDTGDEQVVFADRQPLSSDEVLATILSDDEQGLTK